MLKILRAATVVWLLYIPLALTANAQQSDEIAGLAKFLRQNLIGRTIRSDGTVKLEGRNIQIEFKRTSRYTNLFVADDALQFDLSLQIDQTIHDLDEDGAPIGDPSEKQRKGTTRFEIHQTTSTGELIGIARLLTSSDGSLGLGSFVRIELEDGLLHIKVSTIGYQDSYAEGGGCTPGASEGDCEIRIVDGKLHYTDTYKVFDVNPETLERTQVGEPIVVESTVSEAE